MRFFSYSIHGHSVGSDHSSVQVELHIEQEKVRRSSYKWNVAHLGGEIGERLRKRWERFPKDASFFFKLKNITRLYCLQKTKEYKWEELNIKANLEVVTAELHNNIYNIVLQGNVSKNKNLFEESDIREMREAVIRSRVKW